MATERNAQYENFKKVARELESDESEEAFDRALKKVASAPPAPTHKAKPVKRRAAHK